MDNPTTLAKLIELRDKETPEQRKAFLEAEKRYMEYLEEKQMETKNMTYDHHNNDLVAEVNHFIADDKRRGLLTDYEWLEEIADIVNRRKMQWGATDCTTGLTYKR